MIYLLAIRKIHGNVCTVNGGGFRTAQKRKTVTTNTMEKKNDQQRNSQSSDQFLGNC